MYRWKGAGRRVNDLLLEEKLVTYYNQLKQELYPITTELLGYECRSLDDKFLSGSTFPLFTKRISDFLRHWMIRNKKRLRKPTSTGQKLPEGHALCEVLKKKKTYFHSYLYHFFNTIFVLLIV